jgi:hypothetical protein
MEYVITNPRKWNQIKLMYSLEWSNTDEYKQVSTTLSNLDITVITWTKYKDCVAHRKMSPRLRIKMVNLEKEYCAYVNGMLAKCSKLSLWARLKA